jgi:hypothetical protein
VTRRRELLKGEAAHAFAAADALIGLAASGPHGDGRRFAFLCRAAAVSGARGREFDRLVGLTEPERVAVAPPAAAPLGLGEPVRSLVLA